MSKLRAETTAIARARSGVAEAVAGQGRDPDRAHLHVDHDHGRAWGRCVRVVATVDYRVPALTLPWIGGYGHGFDVVAAHSEIIDPYRAGLAGTAEC